MEIRQFVVFSFLGNKLSKIFNIPKRKLNLVFLESPRCVDKDKTTLSNLPFPLPWKQCGYLFGVRDAYLISWNRLVVARVLKIHWFHEEPLLVKLTH